MSAGTRVVREYIDSLYGGREGIRRARELLADDLEYIDPMMAAENADDLLRQIASYDTGPAPEVEAVVGDEHTVAVLTFFHIPPWPPVPFTQWFRIDDGNIASIRVIYDPRPFLEGLK